MIKKEEKEEEEYQSMRHIHRHMILIATNRDNMQYKDQLAIVRTD